MKRVGKRNICFFFTWPNRDLRGRRSKGRERGKNERAKRVREGRGPVPSPFPLYSRAIFDPFPPILRPATQATLLRTNFSQFTFEENMCNFKTRLKNRDYPARIAEKHF